MPKETKGGQVGSRIRRVLTPDLLSKEWAKRVKPRDHPTTGHCYIAAEALYHLLGGKDNGLAAYVIKKRNWTHWFLKDENGNILDPTRDQFDGRPPYESGRKTGFLTSWPSKRARVVLARCLQMKPFKMEIRL